MIMPIFDQAQPKIIETTFSFPEFAPSCKKFIPPIHSWDTANFRVLWPDWPHPFLTTPTQKTFHAKNLAISSISSGDMVD